MDTRPMQILGIDIGGTKTSFAVVSFPACRIVLRREIATPAVPLSGAPFLASVVAVAGEMADAGADRCDAIGVGICELVTLAGDSGHRVNWQGLPVQESFGRIGPTVIESDVRAAALAEAHFGAGRSFKSSLFVNIGTGISACWIWDGEPHRGANGHALCFASSPIAASCHRCGADNSYILEDFAGGAGLKERYRKRTGREVAGVGDILALAARGDKEAAEVIDTAATALASSIGMAINLLDPEALIVGGGLGVQEGRYRDRLLQELRRHIWSLAAQKLPILTAALGSDAGVIGAAAAARHLT